MALRHGDTLHVKRPRQGIWRTLHQVGITRLTTHDFGSWGNNVTWAAETRLRGRQKRSSAQVSLLIY